MKSKKEIVLIGYSGHAFVAGETILQAGFILAGYLEKQEQQLNPYQLNYLGFEENQSVVETLRQYTFFPAIGDNLIRSKVFNFMKENGFNFIKAIHPRSNLASNIQIGDGTLVCQGVSINPLVEIGQGVIINTGAIIEHECHLNDFVHVAPGAVLAGNVFVGENSFIGANAFVKQGVKIGRNVTVGAGAVILHDLEDDQTYVGNPAKILLK